MSAIPMHENYVNIDEPDVFGEYGIYNRILETIHAPGVGVGVNLRQKILLAKKTLPFFQSQISDSQAKEIASWLREQLEKLSIPGLVDFLVKTQHDRNDDKNLITAFRKYVDDREAPMGKAVDAEIMQLLITGNKKK